MELVTFFLFSLSLLLQIFRSLHDDAIHGGGGEGQGVAVNCDFGLLLPSVTNFFFMYLYIL